MAFQVRSRVIAAAIGFWLPEQSSHTGDMRSSDGDLGKKKCVLVMSLHLDSKTDGIGADGLILSL
jgi:hypothetical protein